MPLNSVSRLCVRALSSSCPAVVLWPRWPTLCPPLVCPLLVFLLSSHRARKPSVPPLVLVSSYFFHLSCCCSPALERPLVRSLSGSVRPAWLGAGLSSLSTLHHHFVLALSAAWQRWFPFLHRFVRVCSCVVLNGTVRQRLISSADFLMTYIPSYLRM